MYKTLLCYIYIKMKQLYIHPSKVDRWWSNKQSENLDTKAAFHYLHSDVFWSHMGSSWNIFSMQLYHVTFFFSIFCQILVHFPGQLLKNIQKSISSKEGWYISPPPVIVKIALKEHLDQINLQEIYFLTVKCEKKKKKIKHDFTDFWYSVFKALGLHRGNFHSWLILGPAGWDFSGTMEVST